MACDDEYVLLEDHHPPPHHHHHQQHQHQHQHQHHHPHQPFPSRFVHKPTPPHPSLSNPLDASSASASAAKKVPGPSSDDPDDFGDTGFCSHPDSKCSPSFHNAIVGAHCFQDDVHPFPSAAEEEEEEDQKSRARPEKRKDRDELSDGGTTYCYKRPKPGAGGVGGSGGGGGDYKKDREEWSDSAIACLLDAYTEKYVQLNRGNLRGRDWDEVASIVSDRCNKQKSCKSIEQCKNKVDNLKKRYKAERHRLNNGSLSVSHWPWFKKMEQIVGSSSSSSKAVSDEDKPIAATAVAGGGGSSGLTNSANTPRLSKRYGVSTPPVGLPNNLKTKSLASPKWRRVVFKISGAALAGNSPQNVDPKVVSLIAREVVTANRLGVEVAIVVGGRNFFCGESWVAATGLDRATSYQIGMMATVMNSLLLQASIEHLGVQTRLQTAVTMTEIAEPYIRRRAIRHLEKGRVVIFGAGTGVPLFTTDTAAAVRASEIHAEAVLKGTIVNGVYDCNTRNGSNVALEHISYRELISRGLNAIMDMTAITLCEDNGLPVVVFNLLEAGNISRALCGDHVGTLIDQSGRIS